MLTCNELGRLGNLSKCEQNRFITRDSFVGELPSNNSVRIPFYYSRAGKISRKYIIGRALSRIMFNGWILDP